MIGSVNNVSPFLGHWRIGKELHLKSCLLLTGILMSILWLATGCEYLPEPAPAVPTLVFVPPPTPTLPPSVLYVVQRDTIREIVQARGRVASVQEAFLSFKLEGWLKEINVNSGDLVQEGDILAEIDPRTWGGNAVEEAIEDAEYTLSIKMTRLQEARTEPIEQEILRAQAALRQAEISRQQAQAAYDEIAWQGDVGSRPEAIALQRASAAYENALASHEAAVAWREPHNFEIQRLEKEIEYARTLLDRAINRREDTSLVAPFSGLAVSVEKKIGDHVDPYEAIGVLADPTQLRIEANVMEEDMFYLTFGQPVSITLDAYPETPLSGAIMGIASSPTIWQGKNAYGITRVIAK